MNYKHSEEITSGGLLDSQLAAPHQINQQNFMPKGLEGRLYYYPKDNNNEKLGEQYLRLHKYIYQEDYKDFS